MKAKDIARNYSLDAQTFANWIKQSGVPYKSGALGGIELQDDVDIAAVVAWFQEHEANRIATAEQQRAEQAAAEQEKQRAMAGMLITSGFYFEGYTITRYSGYISGDDAIQIERGRQGIFGGGVTDVGAKLMESLVFIRRNALNELKEAAYALGCNAVVGVDFDYLTLEPETVSNQGGTLYLPYVIGVTANGNAVVIEKERPARSG